MIETKPENIIAIDSTPDSILNILERVQRLLTPDTIQRYINNEASYKDGEKILDALYDTVYDLDTHTVILNAKIETLNIILKLKSDGTVTKGDCDCTIKKCQHCASTLLCFHRYPERFKLGLPAFYSSSFQSDLSQTKLSQSSAEETKKKSKSSQESNHSSDETKSSLDSNYPSDETSLNPDYPSDETKSSLDVDRDEITNQENTSGSSQQSHGKRIRVSQQSIDDDESSVSKKSKSSVSQLFFTVLYVLDSNGFY